MSSSPIHVTKSISTRFGPKVKGSTPHGGKGLSSLKLSTQRINHYKFDSPSVSSSPKRLKTQVTVSQSGFTCAICLDPYSPKTKKKKPKTLPYCGHTMCEACLETLLALSKDRISCPVCKTSNTLSSHKTVESFPLCWPILDYIEKKAKDDASEIKEGNRLWRTCSHCNKREATHWCRYHIVKLCAGCAFTHMKECIPQKMISEVDLKDYIKDTFNTGNELKKQIQRKLDEGTKYASTFEQEIKFKIDSLIETLQEMKADASRRIEFYILQIELFSKEINDFIDEYKQEDDKIFSTEILLKPYMKKMSKLEDFIIKRTEVITNQYFLKIEHQADIYSIIKDLFGKLLKFEYNSPYLSHLQPDPQQALFKACENGDEDVIEYMLEKMKCNINCKDQNGMTPFCIAVAKIKPEIYHKLYEKYHANVNIQDNAGKSPLHHACIGNDEGTVEFLIKSCKANPNLQCKWKDTPLHCAIEADNFNIVKLLVEYGSANVNIPNGRGKIAKEMANNPQIKQLLSTKA